MTRELTNKTYCIVLRTKSQTMITKEQADILTTALVGDEVPKFIQLDNKLLNTSDIVEICPAQEIKDMERKKQGDYQCQYGLWHPRGQECAHGYLERYEK